MDFLRCFEVSKKTMTVSNGIFWPQILLFTMSDYKIRSDVDADFEIQFYVLLTSLAISSPNGHQVVPK